MWASYHLGTTRVVVYSTSHMEYEIPFDSSHTSVDSTGSQKSESILSDLKSGQVVFRDRLCFAVACIFNLNLPDSVQIDGMMTSRSSTGTAPIGPTVPPLRTTSNIDAHEDHNIHVWIDQ